MKDPPKWRKAGLTSGNQYFFEQTHSIRSINFSGSSIRVYDLIGKGLPAQSSE